MMDESVCPVFQVSACAPWRVSVVVCPEQMVEFPVIERGSEKLAEMVKGIVREQPVESEMVSV